MPGVKSWRLAPGWWCALLYAWRLGGVVQMLPSGRGASLIEHDVTLHFLSVSLDARRLMLCAERLVVGGSARGALLIKQDVALHLLAASFPKPDR